MYSSAASGGEKASTRKSTHERGTAEYFWRKTKASSLAARRREEKYAVYHMHGMVSTFVLLCDSPAGARNLSSHERLGEVRHPE